MHRKLPAFLIACLMAFSQITITWAEQNQRANVAFGSCLYQWKAQPVWKTLNALSPDAFIFLGDNVYAGGRLYQLLDIPERYKRAYESLSRRDQFKRLRNNTPIYATWDDYDYGANDAGQEYPWKAQASQHFFDFFDFAKDAPERKTPGIYHVRWQTIAGLRVQLIMLDTRTFRTKMHLGPADAQCSKSHPIANTETQASVLGQAQWLWLEQQLKQTADLRLLVSSIQVIPEQHCYEKWANFPLERTRLLQMIKNTEANGLILLSGDRHFAEISMLPAGAIGYPLYEITSSGLNSAGNGWQEDNQYRVGAPVFEDNFANIEILNTSKKISLLFSIRNAQGETQLTHPITLQDLNTQTPNSH